MNFTQKKAVPTGADRENLQKLNSEYTECLSKDFLPLFLSGKDVSVDNFCVETRLKMLALDKKLYPKDSF